MGWSVGFDKRWNRDIGYGVPAICDYPECSAEIDRGLSYVCGGQPYGGDSGCGLYFCSAHLQPIVCDRCLTGADPMPQNLTDDSWGIWREENPEKVMEMRSPNICNSVGRSKAGVMRELIRGLKGLGDKPIAVRPVRSRSTSSTPSSKESVQACTEP